MILGDDAIHDLLLLGVLDLAVAVFRHGVGIVLIELDTPVEEQLQLDLHGMYTGFHDNEAALGQTFQFVRGEQRTLHHLQRFGRVVLATRYGAGHDGAAAQCFGQHFCGAGVGCKAAEDGELGIVYDDLCAFLAVVFVQLGEGLDDGNDLKASGSGSGKHHLCGFNLGKGTELVAEEDAPVLQLAALFIGNSQDLTIELLNDQGDHEEGVGIFLRHDNEDSRLLAAELLGVDLRVKAEELFQLGIEERIQTGQCSGHDGGHALFRSVQRSTGEPLCLVIVGQQFHELLELILALLLGGSQEFLDDFEYGHDVPFAGFTELSHQQDGSRQKTFCGIVEVSVLSKRCCIHAGQNDGLGNDLGVLLCFGFVDKLIRKFLVEIHILVHQMQKVVAMGSSGVSQVDDRYRVTILLLGDPSVVADNVALGIR